MSVYIAIDLKSFYASVECVHRGLDPLNTNLVVADNSRTEKTICLAVSPSLKSFGIPGRPRLFEVVSKINEINKNRLKDKSYNLNDLKKNPKLGIDYIVAPPQMAKYIEISRDIYKIYLQYVSPEDIHVYSIDEVFMDVTNYLKTYGMTAHELALKMIRDVLSKTGITATAGIGDNLFLAKVAMDIIAKKITPDNDGVRIAELTEETFKDLLWDHQPLTDFWRVGRGYQKKLEANGIHTMGDIARCSINNEDLLYKLFGINAELLIDHAWGKEPTRMSDIKSYKPSAKSIGTGQVIHCGYTYNKALLVVKEMTELLSLDLVAKGLKTNQLVLTIGYDMEIPDDYDGEFMIDHYGRKIPKHAHGSIKLDDYTSSTKLLINAIVRLYHRITNKRLLVKRVSISACDVVTEDFVVNRIEQLDLFTDYDDNLKKRENEKIELDKERKIQETIIKVKNKYGKNAVIKGMNLEEGATTIERNKQIGGHKA